MPLAIPTVYFAKSERQPIALRGQIGRGVRGVIGGRAPISAGQRAEASEFYFGLPADLWLNLRKPSIVGIFLSASLAAWKLQTPNPGSSPPSRDVTQGCPEWRTER